MKALLKKIIAPLFVLSAIAFTGTAQTSYLSLVQSSAKTNGLFSKVEDSLRKQFEAKKLQWPPQEVYIRSFKYDRLLEVWVKSESKGAFKLFKTYKICMQSGTIGPKRMEGDF